MSHEPPARWSPSSWSAKPNPYRITYQDEQLAKKILGKLEKLPSLVSRVEIVRLKQALAEVALGNAFVWQGGDCAELFDYCEESAIEARIKLLLQMSMIFTHITHKPVVRIGRMAGQYGKPRNGLTEIHNGIEIPKFHGDNINSYDVRKREPDPTRMLLAYFHSSSTLNYIRLRLDSGLDEYSGLDWELDHFANGSDMSRYRDTVTSIAASTSNRETGTGHHAHMLATQHGLYTGHEGLFLHQEQAMTRQLGNPMSPSKLHTLAEQSYEEDISNKWYNMSAHFIWIGDKTRQLDGAHVEYFRGLENPIGIKVGPSMKTEELIQLLDLVDPMKEIGRVTLITRYGMGHVSSLLGSHIDAVKASGHVVVWQCDPMHGNTRIASNGMRTRSFSHITSELLSSMRIHREHGSHLGGVHLELTADAVVECVGGSEAWTDEDLGDNYTTKCDPRLNKRQALELAFMVAEFLGREGE
jgi:3-deoxy-7-phosphoheptulonate synthase